eukprot:3897469-Pyramimonas_sp.AAC.1
MLCHALNATLRYVVADVLRPTCPDIKKVMETLHAALYYAMQCSANVLRKFVRYFAMPCNDFSYNITNCL